MPQVLIVPAESRVMVVSREVGGSVLSGGGFFSGGFDAGGFDVTPVPVPTAGLRVAAESRVLKATP